MLILTRKKNESIIIEGGIEVQVMEVSDGKVKIGIKAPANVSIHRSEVYEQILKENQASRESHKGIEGLQAIYKEKK